MFRRINNRDQGFPGVLGILVAGDRFRFEDAAPCDQYQPGSWKPILRHLFQLVEHFSVHVSRAVAQRFNGKVTAKTPMETVRAD